MSDTITEAEQYADKIIGAIAFIDGDDRSMFYVQSFVVSNFGEPIVRLRWNAETQGYDSTDVVETDGR